MGGDFKGDWRQETSYMIVTFAPCQVTFRVSVKGLPLPRQTAVERCYVSRCGRQTNVCRTKTVEEKQGNEEALREDICRSLNFTGCVGPNSGKRP